MYAVAKAHKLLAHPNAFVWWDRLSKLRILRKHPICDTFDAISRSVCEFTAK